MISFSHHFLTEMRTIQVDDDPNRRIYVNPSFDELKTLISKVRGKSLRGVSTAQSVYYGDTYYYAHQDLNDAIHDQEGFMESNNWGWDLYVSGTQGTSDEWDGHLIPHGGIFVGAFKKGHMIKDISELDMFPDARFKSRALRRSWGITATPHAKVEEK